MRRNPRVAVFRKEYQACIAARKLAKASGEAYVVINASAARKRPMLWAGMDEQAPALTLTGNEEHDSFLLDKHVREYGKSFEVMPLTAIERIPSKRLGNVIQIFGKVTDASPTDTTVVMRRRNPRPLRPRR